MSTEAEPRPLREMTLEEIRERLDRIDREHKALSKRIHKLEGST